MEEDQSELILETWDLFKILIPKNRKTEYAIQFLKICENQGLNPEELEHIRGIDSNIDKALNDMYDIEDDEDDYDEED